MSSKAEWWRIHNMWRDSEGNWGLVHHKNLSTSCSSTIIGVLYSTSKYILLPYSMGHLYISLIHFGGHGVRGMELLPWWSTHRLSHFPKSKGIPHPISVSLVSGTHGFRYSQSSTTPHTPSPVPSVFFFNRFVSCFYRAYKSNATSRQAACILRGHSQNVNREQVL